MLICVINEVSEDVLSDGIAWLRIHNAPESQVFDLWLKTAKVRLSYIRRSSEHTIPDIVLQWPRYRDENGYILVSYYTILRSLYLPGIIV